MREWESVGSFTGSHRAKSSRPDRRILLPKSRRLSGATRFSGRHPQLRGIVPKASMFVLYGPPAVPIFPAMLPNAKAPVPTGGMAVPNGSASAPNFSVIFPIAPGVFPNFPATFPNFSPAALVCNGLFPSHLRDLVSREDRGGCEGKKNHGFARLRHLRGLHATCLFTPKNKLL